MTKNKPAANAAKRKYEPTSQERTALGTLFARKGVSPAPRLKVLKKEQGTSITPDHPDQLIAHALLMEALGTLEGDFVNGLLTQLASAGTQGREISEARLNFMLSVVKDLKAKRSDRGNAGGPDGRRTHGYHDVRWATCASREHTAADQRRGRVQ